jgi:hypothetical protein
MFSVSQPRATQNEKPHDGFQEGPGEAASQGSRRAPFFGFFQRKDL